MASDNGRHDFFCARCGEAWDLLQILNQALHPEQGCLANTLFLEGVGCPACGWGKKDRLTLPRRCWQALTGAVQNAAKITIGDGTVPEELASQFADAIFHPRVPEYLTFCLGPEEDGVAWDWLFGNGFQHRLRAIADFASDGAFTVGELEDGRVILERRGESKDPAADDMPAERLAEAKTILCDLMDPGILRIVLDSRMNAKGFSSEEVNAALDAIGKERMIFVRRLRHPLPNLNGLPVWSVKRGRNWV